MILLTESEEAIRLLQDFMSYQAELCEKTTKNGN